jgi:predicted esterase
LKGGYMHIDAVAMAAYVCNDLPWDLAYEHTLEFAHHSGPSMLEPVTQVAYADKDVPISYFLCEDDFVVQPDKQKRYIKVLEDAGKEVSVVSLKSGHCPMWSMPKELVDKLVGEVGKSG